MMAIGSKGLRGSRLLDQRTRAEEDPMSSMGNLMDVMLVFACGIMIALIAHYNVELTTDTPDLGEAERIEGEISEQQADVESEGASYVDMGRVYQDTETGELYIVRTDADESAGA